MELRKSVCKAKSSVKDGREIKGCPGLRCSGHVGYGDSVGCFSVGSDW